MHSPGSTDAVLSMTVCYRKYSACVAMYTANTAQLRLN